MSSAQDIINNIILSLDRDTISSIDDIYTAIDNSLKDTDKDLDSLVNSLANNKRTIKLNKKSNVYLAIFNKAVKQLSLDPVEERTLKNKAFDAFKTQQLEIQSELMSFSTKTAEAENYRRFIVKKMQQTQESVLNSYDKFEKILDTLEDIYLSGKAISVVTKSADKEIISSLTTVGISSTNVIKFINSKTIDSLLVSKGVDFYKRLDSVLDKAFDGLKGKSTRDETLKSKSPAVSQKELAKLRKHIKEQRAETTKAVDEIPMPIVELSSVINQYLHDYIKERMAPEGSPTNSNYLVYRTGRFAGKEGDTSVVSATRFGITYDYMHYPYDTFEPGRGTRGLDSAGRSPTKYIETSIRKIIRDKVLAELYGTNIKEL